MTYPCVNEDQFNMDGGAISPKEFMQWRHVAVNTAASIDKQYPPNTAWTTPDPLHTIVASWTNTSPVNQKVYGLLTRGGSTVVLMARSRAFIEVKSGVVVGVAPADPAASLSISRFGIGFDRGLELFTYPRYTVLEHRIGERTMLIGDTHTVAPGETLKIAAAVAYVAENWETVAIYNDNSQLEARITSGATQLDLYAYPSL